MMIGTAYIRTMAAYNEEMNRRVFAAAGALSEAERKGDMGAFWGSIEGTLNHLLWADQMWMSRFTDWPKPAVGLSKSATLMPDFLSLAIARTETDTKLRTWADSVDEQWLSEEQTWFSMAANREIRAKRTLLLTHLFNHQTHHRGQVHAMLTGLGQRVGDTDLFLILAEPL